jgi:hypothetical protein
VIESCPTRWNATLKIQPTGSVLRWLCDNEMQAAAEAGEAYGLAVELGDQTIEDTGSRATQLLALTVAEVITPWSGGWNRIGQDFSEAFKQVSSPGLSPRALLDPSLLLAAPLSLIRYPLSIGVKSPLLLLLIALAAYGVSTPLPTGLPTDTVFVDAIGPEEALQAVSLLGLELLFLGRVLLVGLLEERNYVLSRNIRRACLRAKPGGSVVAVLGMAHCNGVAMLLRDTRTL